MWCGVAWCCVVWHGVAWHDVVWRGLAWYVAACCGRAWCGVATVASQVDTASHTRWSLFYSTLLYSIFSSRYLSSILFYSFFSHSFLLSSLPLPSSLFSSWCSSRLFLSLFYMYSLLLLLLRTHLSYTLILVVTLTSPLLEQR